MKSYKKRKGKVGYGLFLSISTIITMATTIMSTNSPAIAGIKYMSAADSVCVGNGACVGAAGSTAKAVMACDGQYDSLPANDA